MQKVFFFSKKWKETIFLLNRKKGNKTRENNKKKKKFNESGQYIDGAIVEQHNKSIKKKRIKMSIN